MKKKLLSILLSLTMVVTMMPAMTMTAFADAPIKCDGGNGTEGDPYLISNVAQLMDLAEKVNADAPLDTTGMYFKLTQDIGSASGDKMTEPIGLGRSMFKGILDGDGHTITIDINDISNPALFGYLSKSGVIRNVITAGNVTLTNNGLSAGVCKYNYGKIENCINRAEIQGDSQVAGICTTNEGTLINCKNEGIVKGERFVAGICTNNINSGLVLNCCNVGTIENIRTGYGVTGICCINGDVDNKNAKIINCYTAGTFVSSGDSDPVCEANSAGITNCYYNKNMQKLNTNTEGTGLTSDQCSGESGTDKALVDYLNNYIDDNPEQTVGWYHWTKEKGGYPYPAKVTYHVTVNPVEHGSATIPSSYLEPNITVTPTVIPESGYRVKSLTYNDGSDHDFTPTGAFTMPANPITISVITEENKGTGTADDPYLISSLQELKALADQVNDGESQNGKHYKLTKDIGTESHPVDFVIGRYNGGTQPFNGFFDGDGHTVTLNIGAVSGSEPADAGLFGCTQGGEIKNVMTAGSVIGKNYVAGVCAMAWGGNISNCRNTANVHTISNSSGYAGGICGGVYGSSTITNCYNSGNVSGESGATLGAVYAISPSTPCSNCYYDSAVSGAAGAGTGLPTGQMKQQSGTLYTGDDKVEDGKALVDLLNEYIETHQETTWNNWSVKEGEYPILKSSVLYTISVDDVNNGAISTNPVSATEGTEVTLNITPDNGYHLKANTLTATFNDGSQDQTITLTQDGEDKTKYTFTMPAANVTITAEFEEAVKYDLKINGTQVTSAMMDNNGVIDSSKVGNVITSGSVTYTPAIAADPAKVTLNNAIIDTSVADIGNALYTENSDLVIELVGNNTITSREISILIGKPEARDLKLTFIGEGNLTVNTVNGSAPAIQVEGDCTFSMSGTVDTTSSGFGVYSEKNIYLTACGGKVIAHGNDNEWGAILSEGSEISGYKTAKGSVNFDETDESRMNDATPDNGCFKIGGVVAKTVVLIAYPPTEYDLKLNEVKVTSAMMDDKGVINSAKVGGVIKSGTVSYTPASGDTPAKLTLDKATIESTSDRTTAIQTDSDDIVIELIGTNTVSATGGHALLFHGKATFIGSGSLNATGSQQGFYFYKDGTFSMDGKVTATSTKSYGICTCGNIYLTAGAGKVIAHGNDNTNGAITIDGYGTVEGCKSIMGSTDSAATEETATSPANFIGDDWKQSKIVDSGETAKTVVLTAYQPDYLWFSATGGDVELSMNKTGDNAPDIYLEYSTDGTNWSDFVKGKVVTPITLSAKGTKVYIRNKDSADKISNWSDNQQWRFCMSGNAQASVAVGGNIMSLLDKTVTIKEFTDLNKSDSAFYQLFYGCELLSDASELQLPAGKDKVLPESCYEAMFCGCTSLEAAPALPAEKLGAYCYRDMFHNCKALETAPALPATELKEYCYRNMFLYCDLLKTAPELPATELAAYCYADMFFGCKALETAPELPATELAAYCYYDMFSYCIALKSAPVLPATNLVEGCYCTMFDGCENLNYIKVDFTAWDDENDATSWWVNGVAPTGNFVCPETLDNDGHIDNVSGVPTGWTIGKANCTVTFDMNGHGTAFDPANVKYGEKINKPENPQADGYTFGGWYRDADCTQAWNFSADTVTEDITLYAKWINNDVPKIAISGKITENSINVPNATVELLLGTIKAAATKTDADGNYKFDNVENGTYNIVVTNEDGKTKTEMVTINDSSATVNVELPTSDINSKVEHKGNEVSGAKSDISKTVAGGLDKVAEKHQPTNPGDKVTVKLTVEPKADTGTSAQQSIKEEAGDVNKVEFLDLSLLKQTNNDDPVDIGGENDTLLTIIIPFDFTNVDVTSVMILRNHGGNTEKLTVEPNTDGEYVQINEAAGNITLYVKKFSDYAIAYDVNEGGTYTITNNAPQTSKEQNHGYIEVSGNASSGERVTVIVHPNKGYKLEKLTYTPFGDEAKNITWTKSFTMPDNDVTVDATFKKGSWDPIVPIRPIVPVENYYTVHFDMQGIGSAITDVKVKAGACVAMPTTPVAEDYEFGGWFKEKNCINAWDFDKDTVKSNMTLYAKWTSKDDITSALAKASKVNLIKATPYKNGKIKLTFKNLKLENGVKVVNYQVYRSTNKKFNKNLKKANFKRTADTKTYTWTNINKLKKGTKYYYKVRGKVQLSDGTYAYTKWSNVKNAKCKKSR